MFHVCMSANSTTIIQCGIYIPKNIIVVWYSQHSFALAGRQPNWTIGDKNSYLGTHHVSGSFSSSLSLLVQGNQMAEERNIYFLRSFCLFTLIISHMHIFVRKKLLCNKYTKQKSSIKHSTPYNPVLSDDFYCASFQTPSLWSFSSAEVT